MQGRGTQVPTWIQWHWQWGFLWQRGTQSPGEGRGGAEGAGHAQDGTHWLSRAGLHPSATGKCVQALSWIPLEQCGSGSSPWGCAEPLAAGLGQL